MFNYYLASTYGSGTYSSSTYNGKTGVVQTGTGSAEGSSAGGISGGGGILTDTGLAIVAAVTLGCLIALVAMVIRLWKRPVKIAQK